LESADVDNVFGKAGMMHIISGLLVLIEVILTTLDKQKVELDWLSGSQRMLGFTSKLNWLKRKSLEIK